MLIISYNDCVSGLKRITSRGIIHESSACQIKIKVTRRNVKKVQRFLSISMPFFVMAKVVPLSTSEYKDLRGFVFIQSEVKR